MADGGHGASLTAQRARLIARPVIVVVMGVSGSGKTTVGQRLSETLGCRFQEGDDLHPPANVDKMSHGIPLTDADREPWLDAIASEIDRSRASRQSLVLSCSALKRSYRARIIGARAGVGLVYLRGSYELIRQRMTARHDHFMPVLLLDSQFAVLEPPGPHEHPLTVEIGADVGELVDEILLRLAQWQAGSSESA